MENDVTLKLSKLAFVSSIIGVCTLGVCPVFGACGLSVVLVLRSKLLEMKPQVKKRIKPTIILSLVSFVMFIVDIGVALYISSK